MLAQSIPVETLPDIPTLYASNYPRLFRFGLAFSGYESKAAEAVQDAFLDLIRNPGQFDPGRGSAVALLYGMVRNRLRSSRRSEREEPLDDVAVTDDELLVNLEREERVVAVREAILGLPEHYREVVVLCGMEEFSYEDAAVALESRETTIETTSQRIRRGNRMKLDSLLKEYRDQLSAAPVLDFEALIRKDADCKAQRKTMSWIGLALAASLATFLVFSRAPTIPATPVVKVAAQVESLPDSTELATPVHAPRRRVPKRTAKAPEVLTGFIALAETRMLPEPRLLQLLRVNVSGDRLAALGVLAINEAMSSRMTAEVLVGDDGIARAVRVVANE